MTRMLTTSRHRISAAGVVLLMLAASIVWNAAAWIDRPFSGFLLLENSVVASAGLSYWPATSDGKIFQHALLSYDGINFESPSKFHEYIESKPIGTTIEYVFRRGDSEILSHIDTRLFTATDTFILFAASLLCAITLFGVAGALRYIAPNDPASLGTAIAFAILGLFSLTALDLYGPYKFFRIHAVAECFLGAGMFHMALVFPYRRKISLRYPALIPAAYIGALVLGGVTATSLYTPSIYIQTHRIAIGSAGASFLVMIFSQLSAYLRPASYAARKRVTILAMGTFASIAPAFVVLLFSAYSGGGAPENLISWAGAFFPISVAYAVLRADALQIDAILRRTVSYAILTVIVATSYASIITGFEWAVRDQGDAPRWLSILAFSAFCTFGILPLRNQVQSWVDQLFFRAVYDFRLTIEETSAILARLIQLDAIRDKIKDAVFETLHPESIEFVVFEADEPNWETRQLSEPSSDSISDLESGGIAIPFRSHDRVVAVLTLGRRLSGRFYSGEDRILLQVLANQGAIAIENALALEKLRDLNRTLETRVENRTAELARTLEELRETQGQLIQAERLAAVGELAAGVAHEVNNPLNFARNSLRTLDLMVDELSSYASEIGQLRLDDADLLATQIEALSENFPETNPSQLAEDVKQLVEILGSGLDRTASLVQDLRDFASPRPSERSPFDLAEIVRSTFQVAESTLADARIRFQLDIQSKVSKAFGNRDSIGQVILNVIKNSVDALEGRDDGTLVAAIVERSGDGILRLTISDNGTGIGSDIADRVFEPFFTTKIAGKGTGLGLSMCRRIMHENGGNISIGVHEGSGTDIHIEIPVSTANDRTSCSGAE